MLLCLYVSLSFFTLVAARALRVGTFNIKYDPNPPTPSYSTVSSYSQTTTATASSSLKPSSSPSALSFVRAVRGAEPSALKRDTQNSQQKPWADRREPLVKQILFEELDIFGLQEVLHNQLEDIRSLLGDEYQCIGVGRDDGKTKGEAVSPISFQVTTEPICFRKKYFVAEETQYFWLSDTPDKPGSITWDNNSVRMATMIRFKHKTRSESLVVLCTHLDDKGSESRRKGSELILQRIQQFSGGESLIVVAGDLNSKSTQEAYLTLTGGHYNQTHTGNHTFSLLDTREEVITSQGNDSKTTDPPATLRGRFGEKYSNPGFPEDHLKPKNIDYVLYFAPKGADKVDTTAYGIMPSYFNNSPMLSDHRLVVAHLEMR